MYIYRLSEEIPVWQLGFRPPDVPVDHPASRPSDPPLAADPSTSVPSAGTVEHLRTYLLSLEFSSSLLIQCRTIYDNL